MLFRSVPVVEVPAWSPEGVVLKQEQDERRFAVRLPSGAALAYDLVGKGEAHLDGDRIVLQRYGPETILWRSLRLVPRQFAETSQ